MHVRPLVLIAAIGVAFTGSASAQYYSQRAYDPCAPVPVYGGAIGLLANAISQPQRARDCAALRQRQWADFAARQRAAHDQAEAQAAAAAAADRQSYLDAQVAQAQAARQSAIAEQKAKVASAARRMKEAALAAQRQAAREDAERLAEAEQRDRYITLIAAEKSPNNYCKKQDVAKAVIEGWNGLDGFKDEGLKVVDIEHLTTVTFDSDAQRYSCHGVFMTNKGLNILGTITLRRNVAGDPIVAWERDAGQDISRYTPPAGLDSSTQPVSSQPKIQTREAVTPTTIAPATTDEHL